MTIPRWQPFALAILAGVSLLLFLGSRGLNEPDEGRYAEIAREMVVSGDWLIPTLNGIPHFQKPPLLYWATAASIKLLGVNEWAVRLPSALAALGIVGLTYWMGSLLFDQRTGLAAALILLSSLEFFALARVLTPDMFMSFWITAAVACMIKYGCGGSRLWSWLFFVAMGLGFMVKGPMAFIVPIAAALSWQFARRRAGTPFRLPWAGGVVLMLAIGLSWFIALSLQNKELLSYFAGDELVKRFGSKTHGRSKPFWFFLWVLPVGLFPWTFAFFAILWRQFTRWRKGWRPNAAQWLLVGWVAIPLVVLSISGSKLPTYVLPLFPALAIALGLWTRTQENRVLWNGAFIATLLGLLGLIVAIAAAGHILHVDLPNSYLLVPALGAALYLMRHHPVTARLVVCVGTVIFWLGTVAHMDRLNDHLVQQASVEPLARRLRAAPDFAQATIFACEVRAHGWEFYLERLTHLTKKDADIVLKLTPEQKSRLIDSPDECEAEMLARAPAYGLVREARFARSFSPAKWAVVAKAGDFLLIGTRNSALAGR